MQARCLNAQTRVLLGIKENKAKIVVPEGNFHGRTILAISASTDDSSRKGFGPFVPNFVTVPYNDLKALTAALNEKDVCGFLVELYDTFDYFISF